MEGPDTAAAAKGGGRRDEGDERCADGQRKLVKVVVAGSLEGRGFALRA
jgi:hypothetical protein